MWRTLVSDSFNRANSASLGNADSGQTWTQLQGTHEIVSNRARHTSAVDSDAAVIDCGATHVIVTAKVYGTQAGLIARCSDINNFYLVFSNNATTAMFKRVAGTYTQLGANVSAPADGDTFGISCILDQIVMLKNGVAAVTVTDSALTAGTKVGIRSGSPTGIEYDDFLATSFFADQYVYPRARFRKATR